MGDKAPDITTFVGASGREDSSFDLSSIKSDIVVLALWNLIAAHGRAQDRIRDLSADYRAKGVKVMIGVGQPVEESYSEIKSHLKSEKLTW